MKDITPKHSKLMLLFNLDRKLIRLFKLKSRSAAKFTLASSRDLPDLSNIMGNRDKAAKYR
jgi:hypothetical protein